MVLIDFSLRQPFPGQHSFSQSLTRPRYLGWRGGGRLLEQTRLERLLPRLRGGGDKGSVPKSEVTSSDDPGQESSPDLKEACAHGSKDKTKTEEEVEFMDDDRWDENSDKSSGQGGDAKIGRKEGSRAGRATTPLGAMESELLLEGNVQRLQFLRKKTGMDLGVRSYFSLRALLARVGCIA